MKRFFAIFLCLLLLSLPGFAFDETRIAEVWVDGRCERLRLTCAVCSEGRFAVYYDPVNYSHSLLLTEDSVSAIRCVDAVMLLRWLDGADAESAYEAELKSPTGCPDTVIPRGAVTAETDGVNGYSYCAVCGSEWRFVYFLFGQDGCVRAEIRSPGSAQNHAARLLAFLATLTYAE